jgi:hypothetical protein
VSVGVRVRGRVGVIMIILQNRSSSPFACSILLKSHDSHSESTAPFCVSYLCLSRWTIRYVIVLGV